jgi:1-deoxy-D-xylulose-5-phosphate reductoisomerase
MFTPQAVCIGEAATAARAKELLPPSLKLYSGRQGLQEMVAELEYDILINALVGEAGFRSTITALTRNKRVALANKESLVIGGDYINAIIDKGQGQLIPVDSEHSAILQCLRGEETSTIESIILTASGGPFRTLPREKLAEITPEQALKHPTWVMGKKITIDAATLVNKGFELIEAHHLFKMPYENLRVVIHPQSVIHSMVEFCDGAVMAQMGLPSMELPIQFALSYPKRLPLAQPRLSLAEKGQLTFFEVDLAHYPGLALCIAAGKAGGSAPVVLNAANEVAVGLFLDKKIGYHEIPVIIEQALSAHTTVGVHTIEEIEQIDRETRASIAATYSKR